MSWGKKELIEKCKAKEIVGYSSMNKTQLLQAYLSHITVAEMHKICKDNMWIGHHSLNKEQLIAFVIENSNSRAHKSEKTDKAEKKDKHKDKDKGSHKETESSEKKKVNNNTNNDSNNTTTKPTKPPITSGSKKKTTPQKSKTGANSSDDEYSADDDDDDEDDVIITGVSKLSVVKKKKEKIPDKVRRSCFKIVFGDKLQGKCPVCKFATISFDKGQFQAAHITAEAKGGLTVPENLVPSCGCNQIMGTLNLFDYMGQSIELRKNIFELAYAYWEACTPLAQMEKELKRLGKKFVLVEFLKTQYNPANIETYIDWLEIPESWTVVLK